MRHGRKSRSVLFDGYKRHVLRDLDTGLVPVVGIAPANAPEASVTGDIETDLDAAGLTLAELHIDRAYLASHLVRDRGPGLAIYCKAWRVRGAGGRYAKTEFALNFTTRQLTCPAGVTMAFEPGTTVHSRNTPAPPACCGLAAPPAATGAPCPSTPTRPCWPNSAAARPHRPGAPSCASASKSSTPSPTPATGKAAAHATAAPAKTSSTSDA